MKFSILKTDIWLPSFFSTQKSIDNLLYSTGMWTTHPKSTIFGPFTVCFISPFILQTCYLSLASILFEVSNQSKPHFKGLISFERRPPMKTNFYFIMHSYLQKIPGWISKEAEPHWCSSREWGCCLGARQTAQLPLITPWRQQRSLYPSQQHHVLNYKRFILVIKI